jgi:hypothetical protein
MDSLVTPSPAVLLVFKTAMLYEPMKEIVVEFMSSVTYPKKKELTSDRYQTTLELASQLGVPLYSQFWPQIQSDAYWELEKNSLVRLNYYEFE